MCYRNSGRILTVMAIFALGALVWAGGGDPWNSKPYQQWDQKDIAKVMQASPWERTVQVDQTWPGLSPAEMKSVAGASGLSPDYVNSISGVHADAEMARGGPVEFAVFWSSSRTIRSAIARLNVLTNNGDPQQAENYVSAPEENYEVLLQGKDMVPFDRKSEKEYASLAWLEIKGSKDKVFPTKIEYIRNEKNGNLVDRVVFTFPMKKVDGSPVIPADTKSVSFNCKLGPSSLQAVFDPSKMRDSKGLDL